MTGVDWFFVLEISRETTVEEDVATAGGAEEGEVTGGARVTEEVVVVNELEVCADPPGTEQVAPADQQL